MIDTSWSKLAPTTVGEKILRKMDSDPRLHYHNGDHVRRMYERAKLWQLPYDVNLDAAILGHDCVYDAEGDKEIRSADYMRSMYTEFKDVFHHFGDFDIQVSNEMIISTVTHRVIPEISSLLIKLDLAELGDPNQRVVNFWNIHRESRELYVIGSQYAAKAGSQFLESFLLTVSENAVNNFWSNDFIGDGDKYWTDVVRGVEDTLLMSRTVEELFKRGFA